MGVMIVLLPFTLSKRAQMAIHLLREIHLSVKKGRISVFRFSSSSFQKRQHLRELRAGVSHRPHCLSS